MRKTKFNENPEDTYYSDAYMRNLTILEIAADWHKVTVPQNSKQDIHHHLCQIFINSDHVPEVCHRKPSVGSEDTFSWSTCTIDYACPTYKCSKVLTYKL